MKRILCYVIAVSMLLSFNGCSGIGTDNNDHSTDKTSQAESSVDLDTAEKIKSYIKAEMPAALYECFFDDDVAGNDANGDIQVFVKDGGANITFRLFADCAIPYFADGIMETIKRAVEDTDVELGRIDFRYFRENKDGIIDGTMANWETKNYKTGIFVNDADGTMQAGADLEWIYEYYEDWQKTMQGLLLEAGYEGEIWGQGEADDM